MPTQKTLPMRVAAEPPRRSLRFAGRRWWVKWSSGPVGPGRNFFDDSTESVDVDSNGRLVLRVRRTGDRWVCAEVIGEDVTGYGIYEWIVRTDVSDLQRRVVLGMFTWSDAREQHHRELDIEVSAWGCDGGVVGNFVVQPSESASSGERQR